MRFEHRVCRTCITPVTVPSVVCRVCGPVSGSQVRDADDTVRIVCERCGASLDGVSALLGSTCLACGGSSLGWRDASGGWSKSSIEEISADGNPWICAKFDGACTGHDPLATGALIYTARRFDLQIVDGVLTNPIRIDAPPVVTNSGEDPPIRQIDVPATMMFSEESLEGGRAQLGAPSATAPPTGAYRVSLEDFRLHEWRFISVETPALNGARLTGRVTGTAYGRLNLSPKFELRSPSRTSSVSAVRRAANRISQWASKSWNSVTPRSVREPVLEPEKVKGDTDPTTECPVCSRLLPVISGFLIWWLCGWRTGLVGGATLSLACAIHSWLCHSGIGFHRWREPWRFRAGLVLSLCLLLLALPLLVESIRASSVMSCGRWFPENYAWLLAILLAAGLQSLKWPRWALYLMLIWALLAACVANLGGCRQSLQITANEAASSEALIGGSDGIGSMVQTLSQSAAAIVGGISSDISEAVTVSPETALIEGLNSGSGAGVRLVSISQAAANPGRYLRCIVGADGRREPEYSIYLGYEAFFSRNSDELKPSSANGSLRDLLEVIASTPQNRFVISGHTDATGTDEINIPLSRARADAVVAWLVSQGVDRSRLEAVGEGSSVPLVRPAASFEVGGYLAGVEDASLSDDLRERINRRVEVAVDCPRATNN
jgi:outer membrane protein OmpA-like peptidoglycan-associated protein